MTDIDVIEELTKVLRTHKTAGSIVNALKARGIAVVEDYMVLDEPDAHLKTLKDIRHRILGALEEGCPARDLASLTRRQQDVSREITGIEEKHTAERKRGAGNGARKTAKFDVGSL